MRGNKNAKGTKGNRGRGSAYAEIVNAAWLEKVLNGTIQVKDVEPEEYVVKKRKIVDGTFVEIDEIVYRFRNGMHALAYHILTGNERMLKSVLDKLIANKTDITTNGEKIEGGFIMMPPKEGK